MHIAQIVNIFLVASLPHIVCQRRTKHKFRSPASPPRSFSFCPEFYKPQSLWEGEGRGECTRSLVSLPYSMLYFPLLTFRFSSPTSLLLLSTKCYQERMGRETEAPTVADFLTPSAFFLSLFTVLLISLNSLPKIYTWKNCFAPRTRRLTDFLCVL